MGELRATSSADNQIEPAERAHQRVRHLYAVSKILTRFESVEATVPAILAVVAEEIPLLSAVFIVELRALHRTIVWQAEGASSASLARVTAHARSTYDYLVGPVRVAARGEASTVADQQHCILLPLVIDRRGIMGALQLEGTGRMDERDIAFVDAVVNQLAIAVDRHATVAAEQGATEEGRVRAERGQLAAERSRDSARTAAEEAWTQLDFARAVTGSLGEGVLVVDLGNRLALVNPAAATLLGCEEADALGRPVRDLLAIAGADGTPMTLDECPFTRVIQSGGSLRSEGQRFSSQGRPAFPVSYTAEALRSDGQIQGAVLSFRDITDRKRSERALADAAERLRFMAESMPQKVFTAARTGEVDYINEPWAEYTGLHLAPFKAAGWAGCVHRDELGAFEGQWRQSLATGESLHVEHRVRRKDGVFLWHLTRARALRDAAGEVTMWIGSTTDIDDQKRAELRQAVLAEVSAVVARSLDYRETLSAIVRFIVPAFADACWIDELDEDGSARRREVFFADPEKQRDLAEQLLLFAPRLDWDTPSAKVLRTGRSFLLHEIRDLTVFAHDDHHARVIAATGAKSIMVVPLIGGGRILGALTLASGEIGRYSSTDLRLAEEIAGRAATAIINARLYEQAGRATRAREDLLAIVSHDLKNPLAVVLMNVEVMHGAARGNDRRQSRNQLESIRRSVARMNSLIQDLLDTASLDAGKLSIELGSTDATAVVRDAIEAVRLLLGEKSLVLRSEVPPCLPAIRADAFRLQQVFANLLGNAIKFTPRGGAITLRVEQAGDFLQFSVIDTGSGIPEGDVAHVFDRFWQARRTAREGTGLGLSIVKGIVLAHGGRTWCESTLGKGSTFSFTVPLERSVSVERGDR